MRIEKYKQQTKEYYAKLAKTYPEVTASWRINLINRYISNSNSILDIGCGPGNYLLAVSNNLQKIRITGIDLSNENIKVLKHRKDYYNNRKRIKLICGDITKMPLRDSCFDAAFSFSTLYYVKEIDLAIKEISRVLKKGAIGILEFGNKNSVNAVWDKFAFCVPQFSWKKEYIKKLLEENDFQIIKILYRQPFPNFRNLFDNEFVKDKFVQTICFRMIFIVKKIK